MSRKTEFQSNLDLIGYELSGSHFPREERCETWLDRIVAAVSHSVTAARSDRVPLFYQERMQHLRMK